MLFVFYLSEKIATVKVYFKQNGVGKSVHVTFIVPDR